MRSSKDSNWSDAWGEGIFLKLFVMVGISIEAGAEKANQHFQRFGAC